MSNQSFILAVDGGGTKTTVWIANQKGKVLGKATTGPMSLAATDSSQAVKNFITAVNQAATKLDDVTFSKVVIGLAGVDTEIEVKNAYQLFSQELAKHYTFTDFKVFNDIVIALASGTDSHNAVCLISGTGSNCFGRNAAGKTAKTGGVDFLLSDQGSGFDIGQQVLRAAVKSYDGRSKKTLIEDLVCKHFKIFSIAELKDKVYHPPLNKTQIGQLSRICFLAKDENDTIASEIIKEAIEELLEMVVTVMIKLDLTKTPTDLVLIGGIASDPYMREQLELRLTANYPQVRIVLPEHPPVYGALQIALT
jgi:N-acetylglucosamine kinase-like BadF-type ATPase